MSNKRYEYDKSKYKLFYHGSAVKFAYPDIQFSKPINDFGRGFYLGPKYGDARNWALRYNIREKGYVYYFMINLDLYKRFKIHTFKGVSEAWLDFVVSNRQRKLSNVLSDCDIIIGPTADDNANFLIRSYCMSLEVLTTESAVKNAKLTLMHDLRPNVLPSQICVKNSKVLSLFQCVRIDEVYRDGRCKVVYRRDSI